MPRNLKNLTDSQRKAIFAKKGKYTGVSKGDLVNKNKDVFYDVKTKKFVTKKRGDKTIRKKCSNGAIMEILFLPDGRKIPKFISPNQ